ncbi:MAG TPA: alpha/beta hydrolase [Microscillaceae bacterium]|nr:alpha/beta hydrolase [Microscillaceae bacterium]
MEQRVVNGTVSIAGTNLGVALIGDVAKAASAKTPVLLFLHEALGSIPQWKGFPNQLSESVSLPAIVYERQGFGSSASRDQMPSKDYLEKEAFEVLPEILAYFKLSKVILVGHSDGGSIALLFASRFPDQVVGLITEAAHVLVEPETLQGIREVVAVYQEKIRPRLLHYHGNKTDEVFEAWYQTWLDPTFADWNIEHYLPTIVADALIIQGADDKYGTIKQMDAITNYLEGMIEAWWVPNCGHSPHIEFPELVLEKMTKFINQLNK